MPLQRSLRNVSGLDELSDTTIVIIALWHMGITNIKRIAKLLGIRDRSPTSPLMSLVRKLRSSKNAVVRRYVDVGLPPGVCRRLPYEDARVKCKLCNTMVNQVPCPACSISQSPPQKEASEVRSPPRPRYPTWAMPGSIRKMAVFRARLLRGECLFHPQDAQVGGDFAD